MPTQGPCISIHIGMTNQSGVKNLTIPGGANVEAPDVDVFRAEVDAIFTGKAFYIGYGRYELNDQEKADMTGVMPARYGLVNYSVAFGVLGKKNSTVREFYGGFAGDVSPTAIRAWIIANRKTAKDEVPNYVVVSGAKLVV